MLKSIYLYQETIVIKYYLLSERDLRIFKNKTKISGGFRTMKGASSYVNALSIIKTSIKRDFNPYDCIKAIFNNQVLFIN